jgi:hypothetical protein
MIGFKFLEKLHLQSNAFVDFPVQVCLQCPNLSSLWLHDNKISSIPSEIGRLALLRSLRIHNNQIQGVSSELALCQELQELWLHGNQIEQLPCEIGWMKSLKSLKVTRNIPMIMPPKHIASKSVPDILQYLQDCALPHLPGTIVKWAENNQQTIIGSDEEFTVQLALTNLHGRPLLNCKHAIVVSLWNLMREPEDDNHPISGDGNKDIKKRERKDWKKAPHQEVWKSEPLRAGSGGIVTVSGVAPSMPGQYAIRCVLHGAELPNASGESTLRAPSALGMRNPKTTTETTITESSMMSPPIGVLRVHASMLPHMPCSRLFRLDPFPRYACSPCWFAMELRNSLDYAIGASHGRKEQIALEQIPASSWSQAQEVELDPTVLAAVDLHLQREDCPTEEGSVASSPLALPQLPALSTRLLGSWIPTMVPSSLRRGDARLPALSLQHLLRLPSGDDRVIAIFGGFLPSASLYRLCSEALEGREEDESEGQKEQICWQTRPVAEVFHLQPVGKNGVRSISAGESFSIVLSSQVYHTFPTSLNVSILLPELKTTISVYSRVQQAWGDGEENQDGLSLYCLRGTVPKTLPAHSLTTSCQVLLDGVDVGGSPCPVQLSRPRHLADVEASRIVVSKSVMPVGKMEQVGRLELKSLAGDLSSASQPLQIYALTPDAECSLTYSSPGTWYIHVKCIRNGHNVFHIRLNDRVEEEMAFSVFGMVAVASVSLEFLSGGAQDTWNAGLVQAGDTLRVSLLLLDEKECPVEFPSQDILSECTNPAALLENVPKVAVSGYLQSNSAGEGVVDTPDQATTFTLTMQSVEGRRELVGTTPPLLCAGSWIVRAVVLPPITSPVMDGPFCDRSFLVRPTAPDASKCRAVGTGVKGAPAGKQGSFVVWLLDSHSNLCISSSDAILEVITDDQLGGSYIDNQDGTYVVMFESDRVGEYNIRVLVNGVEISNSPIGVTIFNKKRISSSRGAPVRKSSSGGRASRAKSAMPMKVLR